MSVERLYHPSLPYNLSFDLNDFDLDRAHHWLSVEAYWSRGLPRDIMERSFENSIVLGLYHNDSGQVGLARMVTDKATFAYLADVYIAEDHRGLGLAKWLMESIMAHLDLQGLRRMMLATSDMHALYRKFGFKDVRESKLLMEIVDLDIYLGRQS